MPAKPENAFIAAINRRLPVKGARASMRAREMYPSEQHLHFEKLANSWRGGTWDAWYSGRGGDLWVEYKWIARIPQRASVKPTKLLSPLQLAWGNERLDEGRNIALILGCSGGGALLTCGRWNEELSPEAFKYLWQPYDGLVLWIMEQVVR